MRRLSLWLLTGLIGCAGSAERNAGPPATESLPVLRHRLMTHPDPEVRRQAALSLAALGRDAAPAAGDLAARLKDKEAGVRSAAAYALGEIGPAAKVAVRPLADALKDKDAFVRKAAARALGAIGPDARLALDDLDQAARTDDPAIRSAAIEARRRIVGPQ